MKMASVADTALNHHSLTLCQTFYLLSFSHVNVHLMWNAQFSLEKHLKLLLFFSGGQEQSTFQADSTSIGSSQSQSGISSCDSQHDVLLVTTTIPEDLETRPRSHSSSDEMNLQHATVSDQESSSECVDDGTLKAATGLPTDGTEDNEDGEMITISHDSSIAVPPTKQLLTFSATGPAQISKTSTSETPVTQNSGRVLPSQDVLKVIQRTSTGTCTSPNLGRRCLSHGSDSSIVCLKQNLTEGHVPDDADISPAVDVQRAWKMCLKSRQPGIKPSEPARAQGR